MFHGAFSTQQNLKHKNMMSGSGLCVPDSPEQAVQWCLDCGSMERPVNRLSGHVRSRHREMPCSGTFWRLLGAVPADLSADLVAQLQNDQRMFDPATMVGIDL